MKTQIEIRTEITNKLIESLREGRIPWRKPWVSIGGPRTATNFVTHRRYTGVNTILTFLSEHTNNWPVSYWATFNQLGVTGSARPAIAIKQRA